MKGSADRHSRVNFLNPETEEKRTQRSVQFKDVEQSEEPWRNRFRTFASPERQYSGNYSGAYRPRSPSPAARPKLESHPYYYPYGYMNPYYHPMGMPMQMPMPMPVPMQIPMHFSRQAPHLDGQQPQKQASQPTNNRFAQNNHLNSQGPRRTDASARDQQQQQRPANVKFFSAEEFG